MDGHEKRRYQRKPAKFDISCVKVGQAKERLYSGYTVNTSPGGLYFETTTRVFKRDDLLRVELLIPPLSGLLEFGGKIAGFAKVLRADNVLKVEKSTNSTSGKYGVAVQFCRPFKLRL